jgi:integrase
MTSISTDNAGNRRILFMGLDQRRKTIRLGAIPMKQAQSFRDKLKNLLSARKSGLALDGETSVWLGQLSPAMLDKLATCGLIEVQQARPVPRLGEFLDGFIARRNDAKPSTKCNLEVAARRLTEFFGRERDLNSISPGDADNWALHMKGKYALATVGRTVRRAKQFYRNAVRSKLAQENPFVDVKAPQQTNAARKFFITPEVINRVIESAPDSEWRLIIALSRWGGLRCPSEHLALTWSDVDWERSRFLVRSSKTEHHEDGGMRWVPLFPELRPFLEEAFDLAPPGTVHVIGRYRDTNANLRTQMMRIIRRAGETPWPKLFHNLRASRETELAERFPMHVVTDWIGNSALIAAKHYLQVTDNHFEEAAHGDADSDARPTQKPTQQASALPRTYPQVMQKTPEISGVLRGDSTSCDSVRKPGTPRVGLEPTTCRLTAGRCYH